VLVIRPAPGLARSGFLRLACLARGDVRARGRITRIPGRGGVVPRITRAWVIQGRWAGRVVGGKRVSRVLPLGVPAALVVLVAIVQQIAAVHAGWLFVIPAERSPGYCPASSCSCPPGRLSS